MKKITDYLKEVEEPKTPENKLAKSQLGKKETANPKTLQNFDVKTKKDTSRRADVMPAQTEKNYQDNTIAWADQREEMTRELIGMINEISKGRLGSYIKAASHDVATKSAAVGRYGDRANRVSDEMKKGDHSNWQQGKKDSETADKFFKKSWKRREGIAKAVNKITNEEIEDMTEGLSSLAAKHLLHRYNAERDFFELDTDTITDLHTEASNLGYRGSDNGHSLSYNFHNHLMRKANKMNEEVENIQEISPDRLKSYRSKASLDAKIQTDRLEMYPRNDKRAVDADRKYENRKKGFAKAWQKLKARDKVSEEVEQIDEVSRGRLIKYVDKALDSHRDLKKSGNKDKANSRLDMVGLATNKKHPKHAYPKAPKVAARNEEVETSGDFLEESKYSVSVWSNGGKHEWIIHNKQTDKVHARSGMVHSTRAKAITDLKKHLPKDMNEEVLDEISKERLKDYNRKVFDSHDKPITQKRMLSSFLATDKTFPKHALKKPKVAGTERRATNEEVELDEISQNRLSAYIQKAGQQKSDSKTKALKHREAAKSFSDRAANSSGAAKQYHSMNANDHMKISNHFVTKHNKRAAGIATAKGKMRNENRTD